MSPGSVAADNVRYTYGSQTAVDGVSFAVLRGTLFGLLGPNGSGKTTLFRLLSTLIPMQSGRLSVGGFDVSRDQSQVRRRLGVTFQSPAVDVRLTVRENLRCHGRLYGMSGAQMTDRMGMLLRQFDLLDRANTLTGQLSGGLKRRVELAKGLMHDPELLLLDEPTSGLDPRARQDFWDLVMAQRQLRGTTIIVATHLMPEAELCDKVLLLDRGRVAGQGSPAELQSRLDGERLILRLRDAASLRESVEQLLHSKSQLNGERLSLRISRPAEQIPLLMNQLGDRVLGLELTRPSLEDVFLELTGRSLASTGVGDE